MMDSYLRLCSLTMFAFFTILTSVPASADGGWEGTAHILYGKRALGNWEDNNFAADTSGFKDQEVLGIEADFGRKAWPINLWIGYSVGEKSINLPEVDFSSSMSMTEYYLGVRSYLPFFFVSGGLASIGGHYSGKSQGDTFRITVERETGLLLNAGMRWSLILLSVGLDFRALTATDHSDYAQIGLKAGITF